jgi:glycosyltransferase involved in cell wall biosynthesis
VIAFLGRVSREKGLDVLEAAFRLVLQKHPSAVLGVIGDGPYRAQFAQNLSDTNRAFFAGETTGERLPALLASAHVFAFPSTTDTFGNAVLEALASGIPAVVTDQGGPCEIVEDGASGFVIAGHDPVLLAEKLVWLLDHPEQCRTMGQNAWERAQQFRPEIATQRHWEFYQKVAQERLS